MSTADVATAIRAVLAEDEEGSRVVLAPEDITFVRKQMERRQTGEKVEPDGTDWDAAKIKELGEFEVLIKVKGASESVSRTVVVSPQEE